VAHNSDDIEGWPKPGGRSACNRGQAKSQTHQLRSRMNPERSKGAEAEEAPKEDVRAKLGLKGPLLAQRIWSDLGGEKIRDLRETIKKRGRSPGKTNKVAIELAK
jgi:hypothetical protein